MSKDFRGAMVRDSVRVRDAVWYETPGYEKVGYELSGSPNVVLLPDSIN